MADTKRSVASLQTLLANNTSGDISPQDHRDMLVSCLGIAGGIGIPTIAVATQTLAAGVPEKLELFTAEQDHGATASHTTDDITIAVNGLYIILGFFSMKSTTNNVVFDFVVNVDGAASGIGTNRKVGTGADVGAAAFGGFLTLTATEKLSLYAEADLNTDITLTRAQFICLMIG